MQTTVKHGGVYAICRRTSNTGRHQVYVGSTDNFEKRFSEHEAKLYKGTHHCKQLQGLWDMCGSKSDFKFEPLVIIPEDIVLPDEAIAAGITVKRFREAIEQLYLTYYFNHPNYLHRNTKLPYADGKQAGWLLLNTLKHPDNGYDHLPAETIAALDVLYLKLRSGFTTKSIRHMVSGDARKWWNGKDFFNKSKNMLNPKRYCKSNLSRGFAACFKGRLTIKQKEFLGELIQYNAVGKLHDC